MVTHTDSPLYPVFSEGPVRRAAEWMHRHDQQTLDLQAELTEIPAPSFHESERGKWMGSHLEDRGVTEVSIDEVGNVRGWLSGVSGPTPLVVAAHLDTVFPPGTDVTVTRDGDLLQGPGISDDGRGLAALLTIAGAFAATELKTERPVLLVATVGEEGVGDLRGVKHLFREDGGLTDAAGFISLDGAGIRRIVSRGVGSFRFRATLRGQGGHSWVDFGVPNPIHALGDMVTRWAALDLSLEHRTTLTVARAGGGKAINAIPEAAWVEVDLRSEDAHCLDQLRRRVLETAEAVTKEYSAGSASPRRLELSIDILGERPTGLRPPESELLRAAEEATRAIGEEPRRVAASTDANVSMSLGIPAITLGAGGNAGLAHTTDEWFRNVRGVEGLVRGLLTIVGFAGVR
jgi:tripeptide aminopeptidase